MDNYTHFNKAEDFENKVNLLETTRLFYAAMHYLHALAAQKNKIIGDIHEKIKNAINPNSKTKVFEFKWHIYDAYRSLKEFSEYERYQIDKNPIVYQKQIEDNYEKSKIHFKDFINYLVNNHKLQK